MDAGWNPSPNGDVSDLKFANSQLYVCGGFSSAGGGTNHYIVRLSPATGAADAAWNPVCDRPVGALESDATYIYFGGKFSLINGVTTRRALCRFQNSAGAAVLDAT